MNIYKNLNKYAAFIALSLIFSVLFSFTSCKSEGDEPQPVIQPVERSILVYIVADNTLSGFDTDDINEMRRAAAENDFNGNRLIIYHAPRSQSPALKEITKDGVITLKVYDTDESSVSENRMNVVINDFKKYAPASNYGLVLWSHASAWTSNQKPTGDISPQSYGDDKGEHMDIDILANVLNGKGFEFVYFDCCHMASIEVAYELRNSTPYIIGSATEIPAQGMPYDKTIPYLLKGDFINAAKTTFEDYDERININRTCTMSVIKTEHLDELAAITREIFQKKPTLPEDYSPFNYRTAKPYYCYDFSHYIKALSSPQDFDRWETALNKCIVYKANTPMLWNIISLEGHCGLSCMILDYISGLGNNLSWTYYYTIQWWDDVVCHLYN